MLKIRLQRRGGRHDASYRMIVSDSRRAPTSDFVEQVGFYDPESDPPELTVDLERIEHWRNAGAQLSDTVRSLVQKAVDAAEHGDQE